MHHHQKLEDDKIKHLKKPNRPEFPSVPEESSYYHSENDDCSIVATPNSQLTRHEARISSL